MKLDYRPNLEWSQRYQIVTTSDRTQDYRLYVKGDLAEYVTLEPDHFKDIAPGANPFFTATLRLPEGLDKEVKPGIHELLVGAVETVSSGGGIGVLTGSAGKIDVMFLYPGKYLSATLTVKDVAVNQQADFKISVYNGGKEDINSARAKIDVFGSNNNKIATLYTEEKSIKSNARSTLNTQLDTKGLKSGEYKAIATVYYDGKEIKTDEVRFKIGSLEVRIIDYTKEVPAGKINPFDIKIESRWNSEIPNVYASVRVGKQTFQTPTTSITPWQIKTITGYLDTTAMNIGEYDAKIILYYSDKTAEVIGKVNVTEPEEGIILAPAASTTTTLLIIIIILLVIGDIIYLTYSRRKKQEELERYINSRKVKRK
ncbi:hypothetical protein KY360_05585 [Candidatus Woesearchaeota archaeon]|nr:hypothetical protein [Candidatus Woesearchaeota archaeon]